MQLQILDNNLKIIKKRWFEIRYEVIFEKIKNHWGWKF
jgi:hypothetical protein